MAAYLGSNSNVKLQLTGPDYMTYTYDMVSSDYEVFPLSAGTGAYTVGVYENVEGSQYATIFHRKFLLRSPMPWGPSFIPTNM